MTMHRHFVTFYWPGSFVANTEERPISSWDVDEARKIAAGMNWKPYGFRFATRSREDDELDSKVTSTSGTYYLGGRVETLEEVRDRRDPSDHILIGNMECNGYARIVRTPGGWVQPLRDDDVVLP